LCLLRISEIQSVERKLKLKAVSDSCQASFNVLENISSSPSSTSEPDLPKIQADFLSLLSLIYHVATKLALASNPKEPTVSAQLLAKLLTSGGADNDSFDEEDLDGLDGLVLESVPLAIEET
jgi:hypothetical protein